MLRKRYIFAVVLILLAIIMAGYFFFFHKIKTVDLQNSVQNTANNDSSEKTNQKLKQQNFFVSGWLPYWAKEAGAASLEGKIGFFSEINPFAFGVDANSGLIDTARINSAPWATLRTEAQEQNVKIIPTILWGNAAAMHDIFSDPTLLNKHVEAIAAMLDKNNFFGVDIDYEGKDIADKDNFSLFLESLHKKLAADGNKTLNCTVEARTEDLPPAGFTGVRAMSWANDFSVLGQDCDSVRIMAYDQVFQIHRANTFSENDPAPAAPNADSRWVENVMRYALKYIRPEKLILGVPTYGWEFQYQKISGGYRYARVGSVSYPEALKEAQSAGSALKRTDGGELSFTYSASDGMHIVTVDDAASLQDKIMIAKKLNLKGISLFKIDGLLDGKIFDELNRQKAQ